MKQNLKMILWDIRKLGLRGASRKHGWKLIALIVSYYLVRDVTLYILIPVYFLN